MGGDTASFTSVEQRKVCVCWLEGAGVKANREGEEPSRGEYNWTYKVHTQKYYEYWKAIKCRFMFLFIFFLIWCSSKKINKNLLQVTRFTETVYCRLLDSVVSQVETVTNSKESVASVPCLHAHFFLHFLWILFKFLQYCLSLVCVLMLMDHLSSSRSLISSPYLPHHFIWPKGNNKSLIHYPLTEAPMWKYLIRGNKLNFNHLFFSPSRMYSRLNRTCKYASATHQTLFMCNSETFIS